VIQEEHYDKLGKVLVRENRPSKVENEEKRSLQNMEE
jgi:hypothetical protein